MPDESFDEKACLQRLAAGDEAAARDFLHQYHPLVLRLVRSHLPRRLSEEDLTQMIFIKIFQKLDRYSGKAPLPHWISRVAVNTCINELRAEKRRPEWRMSDFDESTAAAIEQLARTENDPPTSDDERAARYLLEKLLARLSPNDRLLMNLLYLEERSVKEVQDITGWSQASIKVRAFRARARMKKMLGNTESLSSVFT